MNANKPSLTATASENLPARKASAAADDAQVKETRAERIVTGVTVARCIVSAVVMGLIIGTTQWQESDSAAAMPASDSAEGLEYSPAQSATKGLQFDYSAVFF